MGSGTLSIMARSLKSCAANNFGIIGSGSGWDGVMFPVSTWKSATVHENRILFSILWKRYIFTLLAHGFSSAAALLPACQTPLSRDVRRQYHRRRSSIQGQTKAETCAPPKHPESAWFNFDPRSSAEKPARSAKPSVPVRRRRRTSRIGCVCSDRRVSQEPVKKAPLISIGRCTGRGNALLAVMPRQCSTSLKMVLPTVAIYHIYIPLGVGPVRLVWFLLAAFIIERRSA